MFYINKDRAMIVNSTITEWDIRSGNTSMMYHYKLAPKEVIDKLADLPKDKRVVSIGKLMKKDKTFSKKLEECFNNTVQEFVDINGIPKENIISIKRDAVYVLNHHIQISSLGEYVEFIPKNVYSGWMFIKPMFEFYYNPGSIDCKGLKDELIPLHKDGIISFINDIFEIASSTNKDEYRINQYFAEFCRLYKEKKLADDYYREFNTESMYRLIYPEGTMLVDDITDDDLMYLDVSYNYSLILSCMRELC